jgi:phytoene dehydrogenase-like protein
VSEAEVVVVGGGHNGLVCAAYLARLGIDTILIEARPSVGGCASTVDDLGARFNICHCEHNLVRAMPIIEELDLALYGLKYVETEASSVCAFHDESDPWVVYSDIDKTLSGLAVTHPDQVDGYKRYLKDALPVARLALDLAATQPSSLGFASRALQKRGEGLSRLLRWSRSSAMEILSRYFTDWHLIMPTISVGPTVWGLAPDTPGTGMAALGYATRHINRVGRPQGGSGSLTDSIKASFEAAGGRVRCGSRVENVLIQDGSIKGVRLSDGEIIATQKVVAACDPKRVFVEWVGETPRKARKMVDKWRQLPVPEGYESKIDAVLSKLPEPIWGENIRAAHNGLNPLGQTTIVSPSPQDLIQAHEMRSLGKVATKPTMLIDIPSVPDESLKTTSGEHILSLEVLFTPYSTPGGWVNSSEPRRWLDIWSSLMGSEGIEKIKKWRVMTPENYENEFSMHKGHTPSFGASPLNTFFGRDKELTRYKTSIDGLYLSGAATYPGAGIVGISGRNAAHVVSQAFHTHDRLGESK